MIRHECGCALLRVFKPGMFKLLDRLHARREGAGRRNDPGIVHKPTGRATQGTDFRIAGMKLRRLDFLVTRK